MKKLLLFFIMLFMSTSIVNAAYYDEHQFKPDAIYNPNRQEPIRQNVSRMDWWGQTGQIDKWAFEYIFDPNDYPSSGTYSVTGAMYFDNAIGTFSTPLISAGATYCQIDNTYNYSYQIMKDYDFEYIGGTQVTAETYEWAYYGTNVSQLVSFTCENVKIPSHGTMYLNVLFPNDIRSLRVTSISLTESGSTEIVKEQNELNDKLQDSIDKQEEIKQEQEKTNQELGKLNDNLTNSDAPDGMDSLNSASGWLPPGPVDSLLTLPLSMLNNISTSLGSSCRPINLPLPFVDANIILPCLNTIYSQITGLGVLLNTIGTICAGFMLYYYFKKLYAYIDNLLSLKNNGEGWGDV